MEAAMNAYDSADLHFLSALETNTRETLLCKYISRTSKFLL
jgi:hypothetical protein